MIVETTQCLPCLRARQHQEVTAGDPSLPRPETNTARRRPRRTPRDTNVQTLQSRQQDRKLAPWRHRVRGVSASQAGSFLTESTYNEGARGREGLPSSAPEAFNRFRQQSVSRGAGSDRNKEGLMLRIEGVIIDPSIPSGIPSSLPIGASASDITHISAASPSVAGSAHRGTPGMPIGCQEIISSNMRSIDEYISGIDNTHGQARTRGESRSRNTEHPGSRTTHRAPSERRGRDNTKHIRPAKRSPSSPVSMSPDDPALQLSRYDLRCRWIMIVKDVGAAQSDVTVHLPDHLHLHHLCRPLGLQ